MIRKTVTLILTIAAVAAIYIFFTNKNEKAVEKEPYEELTAKIKESLAENNYEKVIKYSDSLSNAYPIDPNIQLTAITYRFQAELAQQTKSIELYESEIAQLQSRRDEMLPYFIFTKDTLYQSIGYYTVPEQSIEKKDLNSCYLGAQVDEEGTASFTSYYYGKAINHNCVKVSLGDSYAKCDTPLSSFSSSHLGKNAEKVTFAYDGDDGVMNFIASFKGTFKVELTGERSYTYMLKQEDSEAFLKVVALSKTLKEIEKYRQLLNDAQRHVEFLTNKLAEIEKIEK